MKKFAFILAAVTMVFFSTTASAQFMGGNGVGRQVATSDQFSVFWVGYSPTSLRFAKDKSSYSYSGINTFSVGISHFIPMSGAPVDFEIGGFVDWSNYTEGNKEKDIYNVVDVKVPVNLMYPLNLADNVVVYPYAGVNARFFVLGRWTEKYENESESVDLFGNDFDWYGLKRFSLGYQVGLRARISNIIAGIGYEDMFTSVTKEDTVKAGYITISVGVPF